MTRFTAEYQQLNNDELLRLWMERRRLTAEVKEALREEVRKRGIANEADVAIDRRAESPERQLTRQPVLQANIDGCSRLLLLAGAAMFLVGDKFLREIKHEGSLASEGCGIITVIVLMLLGARIALPGKSSQSSKSR